MYNRVKSQAYLQKTKTKQKQKQNKNTNKKKLCIYVMYINYVYNLNI